MRTNLHTASVRPTALLIATGVLLAACAAQVQVGQLSDKNDRAAGVLRLQNGSTHSIAPTNLIFSGKARFKYPDGSIYEGSFLSGKKHGLGKLTLPDGETYAGQWQLDQQYGQGAIVRPDGSTYTGQFRNNNRSGFGIQTNPHRRYEGDWLADMPHGFGYVREPDGVEYTGEWNSGWRAGYGTGHTRANASYEGLWVDSTRNGYGKEVRLDGSIYTGDWVKNQRHGQGLLQSLDGSRHQGSWEYNVPLGPGTGTDPSGIQITGIWTGSNIQNGILSLPSGESFAGRLYSARNSGLNNKLLSWIIELAESGHAYAQLLLGKAYADYKKPAPDYNKSTYWFKLSAAQGIPESQYRLALKFLELPTLRKQAIRLLTAASAANFAPADLALAELYQRGDILPENSTLALNHYRRASQQGNLVARNKLCWMLATHEDSHLRNGEEALALARPMAYFFDTWPYLDTLAAALAEVGEYHRAAQIQEKTLQRAVEETNSERHSISIQQISERLELYKASKPYRAG